MASISNLEDLYVRQLRDLFGAERRSLPMLAALAEASESRELRTAVENHLEETREHVGRVQRLLDDREADATGATCEAMEGLVRQMEKAINDGAPAPLHDAELIAAAQGMDHYEIAAYGCLRTYATLLGDDEAAAVLQEILDQESDSDFRLTEVAEKLNVRAGALAPHA